LRKRGSNYVPALAEDGEIERAVLEQMNGKTALADIAHDVARRYPARFARWEDALRFPCNGLCAAGAEGTTDFARI